MGWVKPEAIGLDGEELHCMGPSLPAVGLLKWRRSVDRACLLECRQCL